MNQTATVHARLDRKTKEASEAVLLGIGYSVEAHFHMRHGQWRAIQCAGFYQWEKRKAET